MSIKSLILFNCSQQISLFNFNFKLQSFSAITFKNTSLCMPIRWTLLIAFKRQEVLWRQAYFLFIFKDFFFAWQEKRLWGPLFFFVSPYFFLFGETQTRNRFSVVFAVLFSLCEKVNCVYFNNNRNGEKMCAYLNV